MGISRRKIIVTCSAFRVEACSDSNCLNQSRFTNSVLADKESDRFCKCNPVFSDYLLNCWKVRVILSFRDAIVDTDFSDIQCAESVLHVSYQSSSNKAESPSASSTHDGSYFVFFICTLQAGQSW